MKRYTIRHILTDRELRAGLSSITQLRKRLAQRLLEEVIGHMEMTMSFDQENQEQVVMVRLHIPDADEIPKECQQGRDMKTKGMFEFEGYDDPPFKERANGYPGLNPSKLGGSGTSGWSVGNMLNAHTAAATKKLATQIDKDILVSILQTKVGVLDNQVDK